MRVFRLVVLILACLQGQRLMAQSGCLPRPGPLYGAPGIDERGKSIVYLPEEDLVLVFGTKGDSISALYLDRSGTLLKVVNFMVLPGVANHLSAACLDPDGMIGLAGHGGSYTLGGQVFACRFDPATGQVVWAREFTSFSNRNYAFTMVVNPVTGYYVMSNNPLVPNVNNDLELISLDRMTGDIRSGMTGEYNLGVNDDINTIIFHEGYAYGIGRFSYSASQSEMRNAVIKLDPGDGRVEWLRLGHVGRFDASRLYGGGLDIRGDEMIALYHGDPSGSSTTATYLFVQRSSLDGPVAWVKQYDLPGNTDISVEMITDHDELLILAHARQGAGIMYLLRLDRNGNVIWARDYLFPGLSVSAAVDRGTSRIVMVGDSLWITGISTSPAGDADMILLRTDLNGNPGNPCVISSAVALTPTDIANPVFIRENPDRYNFAVIATPHVVATSNAPAAVYPMCVSYAPVIQRFTAEVCQGMTYGGHSASGIYSDTFSLAPGCDSIRILDLTVLPPPVHVLDTTVCSGNYVEGYGESGIYTDTFRTAFGCDSIRHLMLSVVDYLRSDITASICAGDAFEGYAYDGMYVDTFVTTHGCDSIRTLTLSVIPAAIAEIDMAICAGAEYEGHSTEGLYIDTLVSIQGCDSIRVLALSVNPEPMIAIQLDACAAALSGFAEPGIYQDTVHGADGCDTIRRIEVAGLMAALPNVFSPNQDGINDLFKVDPAGGLPELQYARLFDRYGGQIFEQRQWPVTWDGHDTRGKPFPPGVYTLVIRYVCGVGETIERGTITLLK